MNTTLKPWQVMPANIFKLALEHSKKGNDFDDQVAFLLLDVGVETTFKTFLSLHGKLEENKEIGFRDLINSVRNELRDSDHEIDFNEVDYFHKIRNKLYHRGDGTKPTTENLRKYSDLAPDLLKILLDVDVTKIELDSSTDTTVWGQWHDWEDWDGNRTIDEICSELSARLRYFHESCAILTEQVRPKYTTRKFALELQNIWENYRFGDFWEDGIDGSEAEIAKTRMGIAAERLRLSKERLRLFSAAVEKNVEENNENYEFVDLVLENINHLFVRVILQEFSKDVEDDWEKYLNVFEKTTGSHIARLNVQEIKKEYETIYSWIKNFQDKVDKQLKELVPNIYRPGPELQWRI